MACRGKLGVWVVIKALSDGILCVHGGNSSGEPDDRAHAFLVAVATTNIRK